MSASAPNPCVEEQLARSRRPPKRKRTGEECVARSPSIGSVVHRVWPLCLVQGRHEGLRAAGRDDQPRAIDQQALAHRPGDVLGGEPIEDVGGPDFTARGGIDAGDPPVRVHVIQPTFGIHTGGPGPRIGSLPRLAIGRLPLELAVQIEGEDHQVVVDVAGDVQTVADDDGGGPALADVAHLPQQLWSALRPSPEQAPLVRDAVAPRAAPLGPVGLRRGNEAVLGGGRVVRCRKGSFTASGRQARDAQECEHDRREGTPGRDFVAG